MSDSGGVHDLYVWVWIGVSVGSDRSGLGEGMGRHGAWIGMGEGWIHGWGGDNSLGSQEGGMRIEVGIMWWQQHS